MSSNAAPWRRWYKTVRWQRLRERILLRDMYTCRKTGVLLIGKHPAPNSPVIHHDKEHRGNELLFWDEDNLMAVSKEWHDSEAQKAEQASLQHRGVWY
ncbi:HNH endonuclease [Mesorhizobium sp. BH1-1-5]|uniref:HNH endonuclease n=1 Tax=Mesorhizobium sp. BH1-1-5 TaxID=2876661 RepID=UPI001CCCF522|nr:HNH endonuclease [Mesorhizobium sp. BH1-1-5]MBZ9985682.1 HNH endonuclease [Mesorhizobium sp. BH1-1-5]